jgi:hypothetical protein
LLFGVLSTEVEWRPVLYKSAMSSSSDNDEIVAIIALVTTEIATRETEPENVGSTLGKAQTWSAVCAEDDKHQGLLAN